MTDTTKYSNASLTIETMKLLKKQSKEICSAPLSISKTIEHCSKFFEQHKNFIRQEEMKDQSQIDFRGRPVLQGRPILSLTKSKVTKHANSN